jgi:uncharacterized protein (UPF0332 family)
MIKHHIEKSEEAFEEAVILSEKAHYSGAANRAYYSMFRSEKALLLTKGILGDSHRHIHNSISNEFVKTGILSKDTNVKVKMIEKIRYIGDYSDTQSVTKEEMEDAISEAKNFLGKR